APISTAGPNILGPARKSMDTPARPGAALLPTLTAGDEAIKGKPSSSVPKILSGPSASPALTKDGLVSMLWPPSVPIAASHPLLPPEKGMSEYEKVVLPPIV